MMRHTRHMIAILAAFALLVGACAEPEVVEEPTPTPEEPTPTPEEPTPTPAPEPEPTDTTEVSDADADLSALVEEAQAEGELTWYTGIYDVDTAELVGQMFEDKYGIVVNVFRQSSGTAFQRFLQEAQAGIAEADVLSLASPTLFEEAKAENLLAQYTPAAASNLVESAQGVDPDGYYHISVVNNNVIGYNPDQLTEEEVPRTWLEFVDPKWQDQISISHPQTSGSTGLWAVQMYLNYGEEYFEKLAALNPLIEGSGQAVQPRVAGGERSLGMVADFGVCQTAKEGGALAMVFPEDGAVPILNSSAVVENAPHPNAARLFAEFLMSKEVSEFYTQERCFPPIVEGVEPGPGLPNLSEVPPTRGPTTEEMSELLDVVIDIFREHFGV